MAEIDDRARATELTSANPFVPKGVFVMERDTGLMKLGPGFWTDLPYWPPSNRVTGSPLGSTVQDQVNNVRYAHLGADVTNSTDVLADVTGLTFSVVASGIYLAEFHCFSYSAAGTTGAVWALNGPASPTYLLINEITAVSGTAMNANAINAYDTKLINSANSSTATSPLPAYISCYFVNGSTAGTLALRFCSEVDTSLVTIKRGSWGRCTRLA